MTLFDFLYPAAWKFFSLVFPFMDVLPFLAVTKLFSRVFILKLGSDVETSKGEVLETGARLQPFSYFYQCLNMFRIFLPCQTIVLRFPLLDIGLRYRYHYDFHRREEHFTVPCRVVRPLNRSEES